MITVLMGAPAAGKTTWVKKNMAGNEHIYSTDLVRFDRDLDVDYYMASIRASAIKALQLGKDVIADGTHTIAHQRTFWLRLANKFNCHTKLIVFDTPLSILLQGNNARVHPCPNHVLLKHHRKMQMAKRMIMREAWDEIETVVRNV